MKAMNWVCAVALVTAAGCVADEPDEGEASQALQGSGAGSSSGSGSTGAPNDVWHGTWNGGSANASFGSQYGSGYVDVFENKSGQQRFAYLQYSTWSVDPTSLQCFDYVDWWTGQTQQWCWYTRYSYAYGWGQIADSDAQITPGHARVKTTLPNTFGGYQCTIDYSSWTFNCGAPSGMTIDVSWTKSGSYSTFQSGTMQQEFGPYSYKTQGTYRSTSATASGSLGVIAFDNGQGAFGDTRGVNIMKSVLRTPNP